MYACRAPFVVWRLFCAIRLSLPVCAARRAVLVFAMGSLAILPRRIWSFYGTWNFAAILRHAKFGKVQIARTYGLLNLAAEFYLEFYRYEILRLSSKFSACRGSTLKFYGQCCEQGKF
ncbi:hypothetical protein [uncultured Campylobacter sp.]|uniref:hypothetical protein n=1 Tax=uncultured Campylobacter sp. TaxID=218934 RepID=UPI00262F5C10|nr:hypothetical protein [uncultured Campylobacter sp.]